MTPSIAHAPTSRRDYLAREGKRQDILIRTERQLIMKLLRGRGKRTSQRQLWRRAIQAGPLYCAAAFRRGLVRFADGALRTPYWPQF